ncbi:MAG: DNA-directed RNA polymerase subunit alpha [Oscillospiraceae bacterium]|nr:DNA-directed RNA polymerase subunit alpha [Erysipelotrichaceae bacterium]MBQ6149253.1 DNA-directed RNA polymerase subunit alpha [Oscillospiraceae bacterium]MBQ6494177.1 DNA-directed RNA polymerase subunit alpha [Erysipelotrichaceae bacterium]
MNKFERPKFKVSEYVESDNYGKFVISPLERGFGTTLGNALRRTMLSSLPGAAVYSIKIDGVFHEFSSIKGVKEDTTLIVLNIKSLILEIADDDVYTLRIAAKGPCTVKAEDIVLPAGVEILNPELEIAHLDKGGELNMELLARKGRGYVSADENKVLYQGSSQGIGTIYTDAIYTPVVKANYEVEPTRVGQSAKYDELTMEVWTDGSIDPKESLALAAKILVSHFDMLTEIDSEVSEMESLMKDSVNEGNAKKVNMSIDDLDLTVRSYNCLKRAGISTVEELTQKTEEEMSRVRNLGKKSLKEVKEKLQALNLSFKHND